jgi:hypothetical protein
MMIKRTPLDPAPIAKENLTFNGVKIGELEHNCTPDGNVRYLYQGKPGGENWMATMTGSGKSMVAAVRAAIDNAEEEIRLKTKGIEILRAALGGE